MHDTYWTFPDPVTAKIRRSCRRGFAAGAEAAACLRARTAQVDAGSFVPVSNENLGEYLAVWLGTLAVGPPSSVRTASHTSCDVSQCCQDGEHPANRTQRQGIRCRCARPAQNPGLRRSRS